MPSRQSILHTAVGSWPLLIWLSLLITLNITIEAYSIYVEMALSILLSSNYTRIEEVCGVFTSIYSRRSYSNNDNISENVTRVVWLHFLLSLVVSYTRHHGIYTPSSTIKKCLFSFYFIFWKNHCSFNDKNHTYVERWWILVTDKSHDIWLYPMISWVVYRICEQFF